MGKDDGESDIKLKFDKLNNRNFPIWAKKMRHTLGKARMWDGVIATDDPLALAAEIAAKPDGPLARRNANAYHAIVFYVTDEVYPLVAAIDSAYVAWTELRNMFESVSTPRQLDLSQQLHSIRQLPGEGIASFFERVRALYNDYCAAGAIMPPHMYAHATLLGLRPE